MATVIEMLMADLHVYSGDLERAGIYYKCTIHSMMETEVDLHGWAKTFALISVSGCS